MKPAYSDDAADMVLADDPTSEAVVELMVRSLGDDKPDTCVAVPGTMLRFLSNNRHPAQLTERGLVVRAGTGRWRTYTLPSDHEDRWIDLSLAQVLVASTGRLVVCAINHQRPSSTWVQVTRPDDNVRWD